MGLEESNHHGSFNGRKSKPALGLVVDNLEASLWPASEAGMLQEPARPHKRNITQIRLWGDAAAALE